MLLLEAVRVVVAVAVHLQHLLLQLALLNWSLLWPCWWVMGTPCPRLKSTWVTSPTLHSLKRRPWRIRFPARRLWRQVLRSKVVPVLGRLLFSLPTAAFPARGTFAEVKGDLWGVFGIRRVGGVCGVWWKRVVVGNSWRVGVVGIGKLGSLQVSRM